MTRRQQVLNGLNAWQRQQFEYGVADCCQFAAHMVKALGGPDYAADFEYESESQAAEILAKHGGLRGFVRSILGPCTDDLQDGDPVICQLPVMGDAMGVMLDGNAIVITEKGMIKIKDNHIVMGWAVCRKQ